MADSGNEQKPDPQDGPSVMTPEGLKESLDELARNVDDLVDRLTMDMTDSPVDAEPSDPTPPKAPLTDAPTPPSAAAAEEPPVPAASPPEDTQPAESVEATAFGSDAAEGDSDIDSLTDRMFDSLTAESTDSPVTAEVQEETRVEEEEVASLSPVASAQTDLAPDEPQMDVQDDVSIAEDATATAESEVAPPDPAKFEPATSRAPAEGKATKQSPALPWAPTAAAPLRRRAGRMWKLVACVAFIGVVAVAAWVLLSPNEPAPSGMNLAQNTGATQAPRFSPDRFEALAAPAVASGNEDEPTQGSSSPSAETPIESPAKSTAAPVEKPPAPDRSPSKPATAAASKPKTPAPAKRTPAPKPRAATPKPSPSKTTKTAPVEKPPAPAAKSKTEVATPRPAPRETKPATTPKVAPTSSSTREAPAPVTAAKPAPEKPKTPVPRPVPVPASPAPQTAEPEPKVTTAVKPPEPTAAGPTAPATQPAPTASTVEPAAVPKPAESVSEPAPAPSRTETTAPAPSGTTGPAQPSPAVFPPQLVSRQEPIYPARARKRGEGGIVDLRVLVNEHGRVVRVVIKTGIPGSELEARAIDAALRSTYRPATEDGRPVRAWVMERFVFEP